MATTIYHRGAYMSFVHTSRVIVLEAHHGELAPIDMQLRVTLEGVSHEEVEEAQLNGTSIYGVLSSIDGTIVASKREPATSLYKQVAAAGNLRLAVIEGKTSFQSTFSMVAQIIERFVSKVLPRCTGVEVLVLPSMLKADAASPETRIVSLFNFEDLDFVDEDFEGFTKRYAEATSIIVNSSLAKFGHHKKKLDWLENPKKLDMQNLFKELRDEVDELENYTDNTNFVEELGDVYNYLVIIRDVKNFLDRKEQE